MGEKKTILHVGYAKNVSYSGVSVAIPAQIESQNPYCITGFYNLAHEYIDGIKYQLPHEDGFVLSSFEHPFCMPDIVVLHEVYRVQFVTISKELEKRGIPYILVPHGSLTKVSQRKKRFKKILGNVLLFDRVVKGASAIHFLSQNEMADSRFNEKGFVEPNGMKVPDEINRGSIDDCIRLLYIGNLALNVKGIDLMLEAIALCSDELRASNANLCIFGPDNITSRETVCDMIARLAISDLVFVGEKVVGEEKKRLLVESDVFIQTSRSEGLSLGILEALSYGLPCVLTTGTGMESIIEEVNAGWAAGSTAETIALALRKCIQSRDSWREKSVNARKLILEHYSWDEIGKRTVEQYLKHIAK